MMKPNNTVTNFVQDAMVSPDPLNDAVIVPEDEDEVFRIHTPLLFSPSQESIAKSPVSVMDDVKRDTPSPKSATFASRFMPSPPTKMSRSVSMDDYDSHHQAGTLPSVLESLQAVIMGDEGAEVTLGPLTCKAPRTPMIHDKRSDRPRRSDADPVSPLKKQLEAFVVAETPLPPSRSKLPKVSLLDEVENTPATIGATPETPFTRTSCCNSCHPIECWRPDVNDATRPMMSSSSPSLQSGVENKITTFLASPAGIDDWCTGWQAWDYFEKVDRYSPLATTSLEGPFHAPGSNKENMKRRLRNRAWNIQAKTKRMSNLNDKMNPFLFSKPRAEKVDLVRTNTFQLSNPKESNGTKSKVKGQSLSNVWNSCTAPDVASSPFTVRKQASNDENELCYDSDPEETTRRRLDWGRRPTFRSDRPSLAIIPPSVENTNREFRDEETRIKSVVQQFMNQHFTLIWHQGCSDGNHAPVAVRAWLERGQHLRNGLIHPKLCWTTATKSSTADKAHHGYHDCDLLDITRIVEVNRVDRDLYPFAQRRKCLLIKSLEKAGSIMFQASSEAERDVLVDGLKMVVARLGSLIIVEHPNVFTEFFATTESGVPGQAPSPVLMNWGDTETP